MKILASAIFDQESPFDFLFQKRINLELGQDLQANLPVDALILWGGEDISPSIYNQKSSWLYTDAKEEMSIRDKIEVDLAKEAIKLGIPIIGICRGAQLMCALSGGSVIQHVTNHCKWGQHDMLTNAGQTLPTNSIHHQMMNPFKIPNFELLAWSKIKLSTKYIGAEGRDIVEAYHPDFKEPEIVWFPTTKSLCIQGHPEFSTAKFPFIKYCLELTQRLILN